jgi:hypothetical protein
MTDQRKDPPTTFASFAAAFADEDRLGRFGTDKLPAQIIGTAPTPNYPGDPVPDELPLGFSVEEIGPPVGTAAEVKASIDRLRAKPEDDGAA